MCLCRCYLRNFSTGLLTCCLFKEKMRALSENQLEEQKRLQTRCLINIEQFPGRGREDTASHTLGFNATAGIIRKRECRLAAYWRLLLFTRRVRERGNMGPSSSAPRVFVIDDEHVISSTLTAILQMHGFSATFFTCPLEAMTAARLKARGR
jgi:hypothetical protein